MSDSKPNQDSSPNAEPPATDDAAENETNDEAEVSADVEVVEDSDGLDPGDARTAQLEGEDAPDEEEEDDGEEEDDDDDALDELDALGVDGIVASLGTDDDVEIEAAPRKRRRSPIISLVVLVACLYPLISMFDDFRYWLRSSTPVELGHASDWAADGVVPGGHGNEYVALEGTPDVQWATVLTTKKHGKINYLRIREGGGQLFAAVPRTPADEELATPTYSGRFEGRINRLGDDRAFSWLQQLFAQEKVARVVDSSADALTVALGSTADVISIETDEGVLRMAERDIVRLVVKPADARVLLGVESFNAEEAQAAVASLGYPFLHLENRSPDMHSYVVRIPEAERDAARKTLSAKIEGEVDESDHKEGVSVFASQAAYFAPIGEISVAQGAFVFPYGTNTTSPGYEVADGSLREIELGGQPLRVQAQELSAVRIEQPITLDPNGYIIEVGADPASQRIWGIMWLVVLGVALTNLAALYLTVRARTT